ncbi:MAG: hypothetical protein ACR2MX_01905 [Cyclobacteriaceae bacterium]
MIKKIPLKLAVNVMIILLVLVLIYHLLILTEIIPYEAAWGGRLQTRSDMIIYETISIGVNLLILAVILIKGSYVKTKIPGRVINIFLWVFTALFALNTIGNLFSLSLVEAIIFTPLTLLAFLLCYRMAIDKGNLANA